MKKWPPPADCTPKRVHNIPSSHKPTSSDSENMMEGNLSSRTSQAGCFPLGPYFRHLVASQIWHRICTPRKEALIRHSFLRIRKTCVYNLTPGTMSPAGQISRHTKARLYTVGLPSLRQVHGFQARLVVRKGRHANYAPPRPAEDTRRNRVSKSCAGAIGTQYSKKYSTCPKPIRLPFQRRMLEGIYHSLGFI